MRISSSQFFTMNVQTMDDQQATLATMYQQIATGNKLQTAADNPLAAAQAVQLSAQSATLAQYTTNQCSALTSLQQEDSTVQSVVSVYQSIQTVVTNAGDGSLTDANRSSLATQLTSLRNQLMTLANTTDANGNSIFGGYQGSTAAFSNNASGVGATYGGDNGQRLVQVSDGRSVSVGDTGAAVFQSVSPNESVPVPAQGASNTGSATIGAVTYTNQTNPNNANAYTITFAPLASTTTPQTTTGSQLQYTITNAAGDPVDSNGDALVTPATPTPVQYTSGTPITVAGESVTVTGTPAASDTFSVTPANTGNTSDTDIFTTLDNLVSALQQPTGTPAASAAVTNALATAATKINNSYNNVLTVQASVGGREQEVQTIQTSMATTSTQTASSLSDLTGVDMASAISQYELTQTALQGAQQAFASIQKMSLFNYISGS